MGQQHSTNIANDTDADLEVFVEHGDKIDTITIPAHAYICLETEYYNIMKAAAVKVAKGCEAAVAVGCGDVGAAVGAGVDAILYSEFPANVMVTIHDPTDGLPIQRSLVSNTSIVIKKKKEKRYALYSSIPGKMWEIDPDQRDNKNVGLPK